MCACSSPPTVDCLGNVPLSAATRHELAFYRDEPRRWGTPTPTASLKTHLLERPGKVWLSESRDWLPSAAGMVDALGLGAVVLRRPTLLSCREVAPHVDHAPGQQRLLYWVLENDGYAFECAGERHVFGAGDVFSFDPGLVHSVLWPQPSQVPQGLWSGWAVPVDARAYEHWKSRLLASA